MTLNYQSLAVIYSLYNLVNKLAKNEKKLSETLEKFYICFEWMQLQSQSKKNTVKHIHTLFKFLVGSGYAGVKAAIIR